MKTKASALLAATSVAVGLLLSTNIASAQDYGRQDKSKSTENEKTPQKITGKLMFLYDYLSSEQNASSSGQSGLQREQYQREQSQRNQSRREQLEQSGAQEQNEYQNRSMSASESVQQPLGIVADKSILLGLGSTQEFYLLTFNPDDPASKMAYQDAVKIAQGNRPSAWTSNAGRENESTTSAEHSQSDRQQVRGERESTSGSSQRESATQGEKVEVTGKILKKGDIQAIAVSHVQKGSSNPATDEDQNDQE